MELRIIIWPGLLCLTFAVASFAAPRLGFSVFSSGAGSSVGEGSLQLRSTVGEIVVGVRSEQKSRLASGFWYLYYGVGVAGSTGLDVSRWSGLIRPQKASRFLTGSSTVKYVNGVPWILFELESGDFLTLELFDMNGRKVRTLLREFRSSGTHELPLYLVGLAQGRYFFSLSGNEIRENGWVILGNER